MAQDIYLSVGFLGATKLLVLSNLLPMSSLQSKAIKGT